jgi:hypothetical protein
MLGGIQDALTALYDLPAGERVENYLCDEALARATVGDAVERGEVLVVAEDADGVSVGLYVDPQVLAALAGRSDPWASGASFAACCLATEGVSHFVYLCFRAGHDDAVSPLELEVQAEVDKYAAGLLHGSPTALVGNGVGLVRIRERSRMLRHRLFGPVRFLDGDGTPEGERYRIAHEAGARYARLLEERYVDGGRLDALATELRRFYRLGVREKLATVV